MSLVTVRGFEQTTRKSIRKLSSFPVVSGLKTNKTNRANPTEPCRTTVSRVSHTNSYVLCFYMSVCQIHLCITGACGNSVGGMISHLELKCIVMLI